MSDSTAAALDTYYARWSSGDFEGLRRLLTDDFTFRGALDRADGPDAFVDLIRRNASQFAGAAFSDIRRVVEGDRAVSLYVFELGGARVPMAEAFEVRDARIARVDLYFDPTSGGTGGRGVTELADPGDTMSRNPRVDVWFDAYDNPMKPAVQRVREIILAADSRITESIKWQAPTFEYKGNIASFYPKARGHVSLMFHQGAKIPGEHPLLEGEGSTSRTAKLEGLEQVEARRAELEAVVRAWCAYRDG